jgi:hypothetical protein
MAPSPNSHLTFASYLFPVLNLPFRRRPPVASSTCDSIPPSLSSSLESASTTSSYFPPSPGHADEDLTDLHILHPDILVCLSCSAHLAYTSQVISKGFTGRHGRAYLVAAQPPQASPSPYKQMGLDPKAIKTTVKGKADERNLINVKVGKPVTRQLVTGNHVVADITCICGTVVGWKYVDAKEAAQKYKIGKFILEIMRVGKVSSWGEGAVECQEETNNSAPEAKDEGRSSTESKAGELDGVLIFDSEDEDECDELFAGTWDEEVVRKRRARRIRPRKARET